MTKDNILDLLKRALDKRPTENKTFNQGKFILAPQSPKGNSFFARMVRDEAIQPTDVYWVFEKNGDKKDWLGVALSLNNEDWFYCLTDPDDKMNFQFHQRVLETGYELAMKTLDKSLSSLSPLSEKL